MASKSKVILTKANWRGVSPSLQVPVQSWFDDMNDTELLDLLPFFEGLSKEEEVYGVLQNLRSR